MIRLSGPLFAFRTCFFEVLQILLGKVKQILLLVDGHMIAFEVVVVEKGSESLGRTAFLAGVP